ncbi:MAG: B12-binding domain-containing radical SAM protein [Acidobacteriaceae bacterium]|nr:B12-binding domain-containing radical SAM protein [Acidobacteriaceae bacterium]
MIILVNARATKPKNRRFPLAILSIAAVLEGKEEYAVVDGNLDNHPERTIDQIVTESGVEVLALTVMPGPQMAASIPICRDFRRKHPKVPIVWGGYFPSLYADAALNAPYVDFAIRGPGEDTFQELLSALRGSRRFVGIAGLSYKDDFGLHVHNGERHMRSPNDFPWPPFHRLPSPERYILPTFLGRRTAVHHASMGCPFRCKFCGVVPVHDGRQKLEAPERTASILAHLKHEYSIDAVQFYDNNFFLNESHARAQAKALEPLGLRWWAEGRVDAVLRYSDDTLHAIRRAGAKMIFFGAESGSDRVLKAMDKRITSAQTLQLAGRIRQFDIVPEFSFVFGNPDDPESDTRDNIQFIRRIKRLNPDAEIIVQHYVPTPHPDGMYGNVEGKITFPRTPEEWASERWYNFTIRHDPRLPWLPRRVKNRIDNFELVISSRWPTVQDIYLPRWGRAALKALSSWRYLLGFYDWPLELEWAQRVISLRKPRLESL